MMGDPATYPNIASKAKRWVALATLTRLSGAQSRRTPLPADAGRG
jgi:hypothetical protein